MYLSAIPRHQLEMTLSEYADVIGSIVRSARRPDAIEAFERDFAAYIGCRHAIAVPSARLGIHLVLDQLDLPTGSEAIVPAFNLFAVIERLKHCGLTPKFCDIETDTLNIDPDRVVDLITPKTKLLLVTHMFGHAANMDAVLDLARRHDLTVLEDCAHALGSQCGATRVGGFGRAAVFSFSVLKLITTFGGGMVTTNDDTLAERIRDKISSMRARQPKPTAWRKFVTGAVMDFATRRVVFSLGAWPVLRLLRSVWPKCQQKMMTESPQLVDNFDPMRIPPLHPFQARLGRSQLARVAQLTDRRRQVDRWLDEELADVRQINTLCSERHGLHNGLYYGVLADDAGELSAYLFRRGIDTETSEYRNCADLEIYRSFRADCPNARTVESRIVRLPNTPRLTRRDVRRIGIAIRAFYDRTRPA